MYQVTFLRVLFFILLVGVFSSSHSSLHSSSHSSSKKDYSHEIKQLFGTLKSSSNSALRLRVIRELSRIRDKAVLRALIYALDDSSAFVRLLTIRALASLKYFESINPLIRRLRVEKEPFVQKELILTLGIMGDQKARWVIRPFLLKDSVMLKEAAKKSLSMLEHSK